MRLMNFQFLLPSTLLHLLILQPSRITSHSNTLIDNIFSNIIDPRIMLDISVTISDHLPQFAIIPNMFGNISDNKSNIYERNWFKFDQENFILDYFSVDWEDLLKIDELNANNSSKTPWITLCLQKSTFVKNKLLTNFINKDPILKEEFHTNYKKYRNLLSTLIISKHGYYDKYFERNWDNKNTWKGIKSLISLKAVASQCTYRTLP